MSYQTKTNRRRFLRSSTSMVALPALASLGHSRLAAASEPTAPKRIAFLGIGFGVTRDAWYPDVKQTGADYELTEGLQPLAEHKKDLTIIQGLSNQFTTEAHWGSTFWLTGANRYAEPGQSFHNSVSADQVAAEVLGRDTRFSSIQLSCPKDNSGHGPGLSLAWNRQGKPVAGLCNPVAAFHKLFSDDKTPLAQRQFLLQQQRSVLDTVLEDARSTKRGLSTSDAKKVDEYFESIREIETRLSKEEEWLTVPKALPADLPNEPDPGMQGIEEIKLMYDLIVAAMQVDASRVFTYRQPLDTMLKALGAKITPHNMSHYGEGERKEVSKQRDKTQAELLAHLIGKLKSTTDTDGNTLFDNTCLTLGSNINSIHYLTNCPTIVTGGAAGVRLGEHIVMDDFDTPLCNLWLTLLNGIGVGVGSHGDSTGVLSELRA